MTLSGSRSPKVSAYALVAWAWVLLFALSTLGHLWLVDRLWLLASLVWAAVWLAGAVLAIVGAVLWRRRSTRPRADTVALAGVALALALLTVFDEELSIWAYFTAHRSQHEEVVQRAQGMRARGEEVSRAALAPARINVADGPHLRVAVVWPGGVTDNWCGAVHDATGRVGLPDEAWARLPDEVQRREELFGGRMLDCHPLEGPWFLCCFT